MQWQQGQQPLALTGSSSSTASSSGSRRQRPTCPELRHGPVVLCATKQAHVGVGQLLIDNHRLVVGAHKGPTPDVLVRQRLSKPLRRRCHRAPQQQLQLGQESLPEHSPLVLQPNGRPTPKGHM